MKKITNSLLAFMAMSSMAMAGGNEVPTEAAIIDVPVVSVDTSAFYLKPMYSYMSGDDVTRGEFSGNVLQTAIGYDFNEYIGLELRAGGTLSDDMIKVNGVNQETTDYKMTTISAFLKPQYPISENFSAYGLIGYGQVEVAAGKDSGLQYGAGLDYMYSKDVGIFVDYTRLFDADEFDGAKTNSSTDSINVGFLIKW